MPEATYQLVVQRGSADFDALVALEDSIQRLLGDAASVDGHDIGAQESNIFILTADPVLVFEALKPMLTAIPSVRVAYRLVVPDRGEFTILYPPGLRRFAV